MKTLNLFLKMHFTSLSPDGQCISLAIISQEMKPCDFPEKYNGRDNIPWGEYQPKSFYAEFTDYDINRCDDWVNSNVVSKLNINFKYNDPRHDVDCMSTLSNDWKVKGSTSGIKVELLRWLSQFSDYKLNFIVDCGWFTWYKFVELLAEWEIKRKYKVVNVIKTEVGVRFIDASVSTEDGYLIPEAIDYKIGLPKLPANFPPVPQDLNELIALKKGISVSEAFGLDREEIASGIHSSILCSGGIVAEDGIHPDKFNALWDAKVTKSLWERLQ